MKICQITYSGFGGLGSVVFSLIGADIACEHDWTIGFIGDQPLDVAYPRRCAAYGVRYASFQTRPGRPFRAWRALKGWLDDVRPDAILCHSINAVLACRWHTLARDTLLITVEHTANQLKTRNEWAASRVSMLVSDQVIVLTDEYRNQVKDAHGWLFRPSKLAVIPNGIDTTVFRPVDNRSSPSSTTIRLGMAARFSFSKRQDLLVDTLDRLRALRPDLTFHLSLAGDGSELPRVQRWTADSPVADHIQFEGLLDEQAIAPWMRGLDIYVHATDGETLSTSLLQAMATGLPIVASAIPGVTNLLGQTGEYGLCAANDADAFARSILRIVESNDLAHALAKHARAQVLARYSNQVMLRAYLDLIAACH